MNGKTSMAEASLLMEDRNAEILLSRARALASEPEPEQGDGETLEVVQFQLASEAYAVESKWVREIYPMKELTPVPCTPAFVKGIVNVRGQILTVVDFRGFFDLPFKGITDLNKMIILRNEKMELGILADSITSMRKVSMSAMQSSLPTLEGIRIQYLLGVTDDRVVVIDAPRLMSSKEIIVNEEAGHGR